MLVAQLKTSEKAVAQPDRGSRPAGNNAKALLSGSVARSCISDLTVSFTGGILHSCAQFHLEMSVTRGMLIFCRIFRFRCAKIVFQAQDALKKGEVPVGCVVVHRGKIVCQGSNETIITSDVNFDSSTSFKRNGCSGVI